MISLKARVPLMNTSEDKSLAIDTVSQNRLKPLKKYEI